MTVRTTPLGGTDFVDGEVHYATDLNDTFQAVDEKNQLLGEVRMFALSMTGAVTKANLQAKGWAICDGTTPTAQGISSATITTTPNLENKFIRMSDDETSGTTGGSDTHNHQWHESSTGTYGGSYESNGTTTNTFPTGGVLNPGTNYNFWRLDTSAQDYYTKNASTLPAYYELAFFIKVKVL